MDIHKPKAAHSWREFLTEIGTIICGILIALGLEQGIEALHWRHTTELVRKSLVLETEDNLGTAAYRVMVAPCMEDRIHTLYSKLAADRSSAWTGDALPLSNGAAGLPMAVNPAYAFYPDGNWQAALAMGVTSHMRESESNEYAYGYRAVADLRTMSTEEHALAARIQPLAIDQQLSATDRLSFEKDLADLDRLNAQMTNFARKFLEGSRRGGMAVSQSSLELRLANVRSVYGNCVRPVGSTADALAPGYSAAEVGSRP